MEQSAQTVTIIISSGIVSFLVSLLTLVFGLGRYKQKIDTLETDKINNHHSINEFRTEIAALKEFKVQAKKFIDKSIYKSASPLSLTELGQKLVSESGFTKIFDEEKDNLATMLEKDQPNSKYDVQEKARELMDNLKQYPAFQPIKSFAYNNGQDYGQILRAGAILLRDYYLTIHPEINN